MGAAYQRIEPMFPSWEGQENLFTYREWFSDYSRPLIGRAVDKNNSSVWDAADTRIGTNTPGTLMYPQEATLWTDAFLTNEPAVFQASMNKFLALMEHSYDHLLDDLIDYFMTIINAGGVPGTLGTEPPIYTTVGETVTELEDTGLPVVLNTRYTATLAAVEAQLTDELAIRMEEKNVSGGRYSSGAQWAIALATQKALTEWGVGRSAEEVEALEKAATRRITAGSLGVDLGKALDARQFAVLASWDAAQHRQYIGLQAGWNLASTLAQLPLNTASSAASHSMTEWQMQMTAIQNEWQHWQVTLPQNNPMLKLIYGYSTSFPQGASAPQIAESPWMGAMKGVLSAAGAVGGALALGGIMKPG